MSSDAGSPDHRFFEADFRPPFRARFRGGTFAPARRASDSPIAIACLRLVTFLPDRPLRSCPCLRSRITLATFRDAFLPYFAILSSSCNAHRAAKPVGPRAR